MNSSHQGNGLHFVMQAHADAITPAPLTELDALLTDYQRRTNDEHSIRCMTTGEDGRDSIDESIAGKRQIVTPEIHQKFREATSQSARNYDEIDEAMADPVRDHVPQARPQRKARGLLRLLDSLEDETINLEKLTA